MFDISVCICPSNIFGQSLYVSGYCPPQLFNFREMCHSSLFEAGTSQAPTIFERNSWYWLWIATRRIEIATNSWWYPRYKLDSFWCQKSPMSQCQLPNSISELRLLWLCSAHHPRWCTRPEMPLSSEVNLPVPRPPSMFRVLARASHDAKKRWNLRTICKA